MKSSAHLLCIIGPTGVGKTAVAIELCALLDGEIISADSMQIYRGLDIATAKPTAEEQARARHHLIDIREPDQPYSAAQWAGEAAAAIADIRARGKTPIIVGGTGFYIRTLLNPDLLAATPPDAALRARLETELQEHGPLWLHAQLQARDAAAATRLHPNDTYRVIRALEIAQGARPAILVRRQSAPPRPCVFGLTMPREQLYARLNARIDTMLANGFRQELEFAARFDAALPSMMGVGYRQMRPALENPALWDAGVEDWKRDTRRYAKRQMTWFRHQMSPIWMDVTGFESARAIAQEITRQYHAMPG